MGSSTTIGTTSIRTTSDSSPVAENTIVDVTSPCQTLPANAFEPRCEPPSGTGSPEQAMDAPYEPMFENELRVEPSGTTEQIDGEPGLPTTMDLVRDVFSRHVERGNELNRAFESFSSQSMSASNPDQNPDHMPSSPFTAQAEQLEKFLDGAFNIQAAASMKSIEGTLISNTVKSFESFWKTLMRSQ